MRNRLIAIAAALVVVVALVSLALVAGGDADDDPAVLPVLGAGGGAGTASLAADEAAGSTRMAGRTIYEVDGKLPGLADEAAAWELEAGEPSEDDILELAEVLDVEGDVEENEHSWTVGTDERRLDVQKVSGNPWSLYETFVDPVPAVEQERRDAAATTESFPATSDPDAPVSTITACAPCPPDAMCTQVECDDTPMPEPERPADLPSEDEAERQGRDLLEQLGVDLDEAEVRVEDGFSVWNVFAEPVVGGLPTVGMTTSVGIGPKGAVQFANGWLSDPTEGDTYPLIGTAAGLEQLQEQQPMTLELRAPCEPGTECTEPEPVTVRIVGVRLGLQVFTSFEPGEPGWLVPSYLFEVEDGWEIPVIAVDDAYLGEQVVPEPEPMPEPDPGAEPHQSGESCAGQSTGAAPGEEPEVSELQVCGPGSAKVGEPVAFEVVAKGQVRDDCASPIADFGDGTDVPVCEIGCTALPDEPGEVTRTFEHTYEEPGTYTVTIALQGCPGGEQATMTHEVRVEG